MSAASIVGSDEYEVRIHWRNREPGRERCPVRAACAAGTHVLGPVQESGGKSVEVSGDDSVPSVRQRTGVTIGQRQYADALRGHGEQRSFQLNFKRENGSDAKRSKGYVPPRSAVEVRVVPNLPVGKRAVPSRTCRTV